MFKKVILAILIFTTSFTVISCSEENTTENPVFENGPFYLDSFNLIWEDYVLSAYKQNNLDIESIENITIIGGSFYFDDIFIQGETFEETYSIEYEMILEHEEGSNQADHHYSVAYSVGYVSDIYIRSIESSSLTEIDSESNLNDYILDIKSTYATAQNQNNQFIEQIENDYADEDSTFFYDLIEDTYQYEALESGIRDFNIIEEDFLLYILYDDYASLAGFASNDTMDHVVIPEEVNGLPVTKIRDFGFSKSSLTSIVIASSVEEIGNNVFYESQLESISFESDSSLDKIGYNTFSFTELSSVTLPATLTYIGEGAFNDISSLESISVATNNNYYHSIDGVLYNNDLTEIIKYPEAKTNNSYEIKASVVKIGRYAFNKTETLESITFEDNSQLTIIGHGAFSQAGLTSILIPKSVEEIMIYAFYNTLPLQSITFEDNSQLKIIGEWAFSRTSITSSVIPSSVEQIDKNAFSLIFTLSRIYSEALDKPEDWHEDWNPDKKTVEWNYSE